MLLVLSPVKLAIPMEPVPPVDHPTPKLHQIMNVSCALCKIVWFVHQVAKLHALPVHQDIPWVLENVTKCVQDHSVNPVQHHLVSARNVWMAMLPSMEYAHNAQPLIVYNV